MNISKQDLLYAGGAVAAVLGITWWLKRRQTSAALPQLEPTSAAASAALPPPTPGMPRLPRPAEANPDQSLVVTSRFRPGTPVRTTGPYTEIGYRIGSLTAPNTGRIRRGDTAGIADGCAWRHGAHVFERLSFRGQKVFIVQSLLEPAAVQAAAQKPKPAERSPIRSFFSRLAA